MTRRAPGAGPGGTCPSGRYRRGIDAALLPLDTLPSLDGIMGSPSQRTVILAAGLAALVVVLSGRLWRPARTVVTIAHEAGHAGVAVLSGRTLTRIRLHSDTSGVTVSRGRPEGPGMVATTAAGYATPPLLGLGAAALVAGGAVGAMLGLGVVLLLATLVIVRNVFGAVAVLLVGAVLGLVVAYGSTGLQYAFACFVVWFLIVGGLRTVVELQRKRARRGATRSDVDQLEHLTGLPARIWTALFALVGLGALLGATRLLLAWPPSV